MGFLFPFTMSAPSDDVPTRAGVTPAAETHQEKAPLTSISDIGIRTDRNARHRRTMEDTHTYVDGFMDDSKCGFFGVYDGHGGKQAAEFVRDHLHVVLAEKLGSITDKREALKEAFLTRGGKGLRLSLDHKASDPAEVERIQAAGGFVVMNRVNGILAVARALGDRSMKDYVSGEPYVEVVEVTEEDTHLILACDGVWDVIEDDKAVEIILEQENASKAATELLRSALKAGSTDNISVMVIKL